MSLELFSLAGKVALVTGASRGLGRGMACALAEAGADLALVSRTLSGCEEVACEVQAQGRRALPLAADVTQAGQVQAAVQAAREHFGRIDVLVTSAGINIRQPAAELTEANWDQVIDVQLRAVFFTCQAVGRIMIEQGGGKIINVASLTTAYGMPHIQAYCAAKGGIGQLSKSLAVEWAAHNIRVNAIGPGYFMTDLSAGLHKDPEKSRRIQERIPLGRFGMPADLAGAVIFLASSASDYVTGQIIWVDGGVLAG
jgi:2-dehydro-3-deoxy-D-gluconate 5-dehydrogenase